MRVKSIKWKNKSNSDDRVKAYLTIIMKDGHIQLGGWFSDNWEVSWDKNSFTSY